VVKLKQSKDALSYWNFSDLWVILQASRRALGDAGKQPVFCVANDWLKGDFPHI
jgi:hypothetical protein